MTVFDKAKVEAGVKHVYHGVLAKLETSTFFSLNELNQAIRQELAQWNQKPFQKLAGTRRQLFEEIDKPALKELPRQHFEFAQWRKAKVHIDYHIQLEKHFYSVPYALVGKEVDVRITKNTIEIFFKGTRISSHLRSTLGGRFSTLEEHMPMHHRDYLKHTTEKFLSEARTIGPWTERFVQGVLENRKHPGLGYRTCLGLMRLAKKYGAQRMEAACQKAVNVGGFSYRSLESLLLHRLDQFHQEPAKEHKILHLNIRGASYYKEQQEELDNADTSNTGQIAELKMDWHA